MKKANGVGLIINQPSLVHCHLIGRITLRMTVIINIAKSSQPLKQSQGKDTSPTINNTRGAEILSFPGSEQQFLVGNLKSYHQRWLRYETARRVTSSTSRQVCEEFWFAFHNLCMGTEYLGIIKGSSPCFAQGRLSLFLWFSLATRIPYLKPCIRRYFLPDFGDG